MALSRAGPVVPNPFECRRRGRREGGADGRERGAGDAARLKLGICGEHGGDPESVACSTRPGSTTLLLTVPGSDRSARRGARRCWRRRSKRPADLFGACDPFRRRQHHGTFFPWPFPTRTCPGARGDRHRGPDQRARRAEEVGPALDGPVPVPRREDPVVLGQRRGGPLLLLRVPGLGRPDHLRPRDPAPGLRRRRAPARRPGGDRAARGRRRRTGAQGPPGVPRRHGPGRRVVPRAPARARPTPAGRATTCAREAITGDVARQFQLGWAPDEWDALRRALKLNEKVLDGDRVSGSSTTAADARTRCARGSSSRSSTRRASPIAVGGRILPPAPGAPPPERRRAQVQEQPETPIYSKRRTLYALNWAKDDIIRSGEIIVCEGYTDVIAFFQRRAAARRGDVRHRPGRGALPRHAQLRQADRARLRRRRRRARAPPPRSTSGSASTRSTSPSCRLPAGTDPGELAQRDPEALRRAVADAVPFLQFRLERVLEAADLTTAEGRARAAERRWPCWPSTRRARARPVPDAGRGPLPGGCAPPP